VYGHRGSLPGADQARQAAGPPPQGALARPAEELCQAV